MTILESLAEILIVRRGANIEMDKVDQIFKIFISALNDKVPNVVFCAIRLLTNLKKYDTYYELWDGKFKAIITKLADASDNNKMADKDVVYFAYQALKPIKGTPIE